MGNPYQPPQSSLSPDATRDIERLDVSETWKQRFRLIERAGGVTQPHFKQLAFNERMKANFNPLAFFFGPVYFAIKGMWKLALSYLACAVAVVAVLSAFGVDRHIQSVGIGLAVAFSMRANVNYYSKKVLGIDRWF